MTPILISKGKSQYKNNKIIIMFKRKRFKDKDVLLFRAALMDDPRINVWSYMDEVQPEWLKKWKGTGKWGVLLRAALHSACSGIPHRVASLTMFESSIEVCSATDKDSSIGLPFKESFKDPRKALRSFTHRVGCSVRKYGFNLYYPYLYKPYTWTDVEIAYHHIPPEIRSGSRILAQLADENTRMTVADPLNMVLLKAQKAYIYDERRYETTFRMHPHYCSIHDEICSIYDEKDKGPDESEESWMHYEDWREALKYFFILIRRRKSLINT